MMLLIKLNKIILNIRKINNLIHNYSLNNLKRRKELLLKIIKKMDKLKLHSKLKLKMDNLNKGILIIHNN